MPIEIRELVIKAVVSPEDTESSGSGKLSEKKEKRIIEKAVNQALEIIDKRRER